MDGTVYSPITFICFKTTLPLLNTEREREREAQWPVPYTIQISVSILFVQQAFLFFFLKYWDEPKTKLVLSS